MRHHCLTREILPLSVEIVNKYLPLAVTFLSGYKSVAMKLLSTTQAAEILGVNDSRIRQLIRDGQLQAVQVGRAYLLDETVVQSFQRPPMGRPKKEAEATMLTTTKATKSAKKKG